MRPRFPYASLTYQNTDINVIRLNVLLLNNEVKDVTYFELKVFFIILIFSIGFGLLLMGLVLWPFWAWLFLIISYGAKCVNMSILELYPLVLSLSWLLWSLDGLCWVYWCFWSWILRSVRCWSKILVLPTTLLFCILSLGSLFLCWNGRKEILRRKYWKMSYFNNMIPWIHF